VLEWSCSRGAIATFDALDALDALGAFDVSPWGGIQRVIGDAPQASQLVAPGSLSAPGRAFVGDEIASWLEGRNAVSIARDSYLMGTDI
jgi:hypothetical protein